MRLTLTKQTEYALRALVWLAQADELELANAHTSGSANGNGHTSANGHANRHANGDANGNANGNANGYSAANGSSRHKAAAISSAVGIPPVFAARVFAQLQRQGLLHARAGQQGGYTLARPATEISLLDVIEAVEGRVGSRDCVLRDAACGVDGTCLLHHAWNTAQNALRTELARTPLVTHTPSMS